MTSLSASRQSTDSDAFAVTKNITSNECGVVSASKASETTALSLIFVPLQSLFFLARVCAKVMKLTAWGYDDTTITIAYVRWSSSGVGVLQAEADTPPGIGHGLRGDDGLQYVSVTAIFSSRAPRC